MTAGDRLEGVSRHDLVLAAIPLAFLLVYALGAHLSVSRAAAVAGASLASGVLVVDGLFVHPPESRRRG